MPIVTVRGAHGETVSLTYDNAQGLFGRSNVSLARAIAEAITKGVNSGTVFPTDNAGGPPPPVPHGETGEFVQSKSGVTVLPPHYNDVVVSAPSAVIIGDGSPNEKILVGSGNLTFVATGGSGTIIGGGGNNLIDIPADDHGSWVISLGNGNNTIVAAGGGNDTISTGTGYNQIQLGAGNSIVQTSGTDTISAHGSDTVISGRGHLGHGGRTVTFIDGSDGSTVIGGSRIDTVTGGSGDHMHAYGNLGQLLQTGVGYETLYGTYHFGSDTFKGGSGNDSTGGHSIYAAGSGNVTIGGAPSGHNVFEFIKHQAGETQSMYNLSNVPRGAFDLSGGQNYTPTQHAASGGLTVTLSDGSKITFENLHHDSVTKISHP